MYTIPPMVRWFDKKILGAVTKMIKKELRIEAMHFRLDFTPIHYNLNYITRNQNKSRFLELRASGSKIGHHARSDALQFRALQFSCWRAVNRDSWTETDRSSLDRLGPARTRHEIPDELPN